MMIGNGAKNIEVEWGGFCGGGDGGRGCVNGDVGGYVFEDGSEGFGRDLFLDDDVGPVGIFDDRGGGLRIDGEAGTVYDGFAQFLKGDAFARVGFKDTGKDLIELV